MKEPSNPVREHGKWYLPRRIFRCSPPTRINASIVPELLGSVILAESEMVPFGWVTTGQRRHQWSSQSRLYPRSTTNDAKNIADFAAAVNMIPENVGLHVTHARGER